MKIVIFLKGPVRPNVEFCIENFQRIAQMFVGYETKFVLHTWNNALDQEFAHKLSDQLGSVILCGEPDRKNVEENLLPTRTPEGCSAFNAFKHFLTLKNGSRFIYDTYGEYDFVFYFRLDVSYSILDMDQCLQKDAYTTGATGSIILDITGCAPPEMFMKAWDYKDLHTLNALYRRSRHPEGCFGNILQMNAVNYVLKNFRNTAVKPVRDNVVLEYSLHPSRQVIP